MDPEEERLLREMGGRALSDEDSQIAALGGRELASAQAQEPEEPDLSEIGGGGLKGEGNAGSPMRIYGAGAQTPQGMVQTGRARRTLVLPEMTGLERPGDPVGRSTVVEDREVRDASPLERAVDFAAPRIAAPQVWNQFGFDMPTTQSIANASAPNLDLSERITAAVPTAPRPAGMSPQAGDRRSIAGVQGLGTGNPLIGSWLDEATGAWDVLTDPGPRRIRGTADPNHPIDLGPAEFNPRFDRTPSEIYREGRDDARRTLGETERQAPHASMLGAAAPALALGLAGGPTATTALGRIGQAAGVGAGLGALSGAGSADEIGDVPLDALEQGAIGGATAGGLQGVGEGAAALLPRVSAWLNRGAEAAQDMAAADAMRARGLPVNSLPRTAYGRTVQRMGGEQGVAAALDAEGIGGRVPSPSSSMDAVTREGGLFDRAAAEMDSVHQAMAQAGDTGRVDSRTLASTLSQMRDRLAQTRTGPHQQAAQRLQSDLIDPLLERVEGVGAQNVAPMTFEEAHALRQAYDDIAGWGSSGQPTDRALASFARGARQELSGLMDDSIESVSPQLRDTWRAANQRWQLASLIRDNARAQGSQLPGSVMEAMGENFAGRLGGRVAGGLVSNYGPAIRSRSLQGLASMLRALGGSAQRWAPVLEQAAQQGNEALVATHYVLTQSSPEYRQAVQQAQEAQEQQQ